MSDLWAVRTVDRAQGALDVYYPTESKEDAEESAGRVNAWVADMQNRHPDLGLGLVATVIEWPDSPEAHATALAEQRRAESDWEDIE